MHSQNAEEEHILKYFGDFIGTFVSIGENDGVTFSNVRALANKGWRGIAVEPSPKAFARLKNLYKDRKDIYVYNYAIENHNGKAILQESAALCSAADVGLVSTFHQHEKERFSRTVAYDPVEVKTYRWKTALNRWAFKEFDFVAIDAEGSDLDILKQIDLDKTRLVIVEWNSKPEMKAEFEKILRDFKIIYTSAENLLFAR